MLARRKKIGLKTSTTKKPSVIDPRGFELFVNLPSEIKLAIFDYVPFAQWIVSLSSVCKEWRKLCLQSQTPKILQAEKFTPYGLITATALYEIVKNYQVVGLDIKGLSPSFREKVSWTLILTASKQLSWVNMVRLIREMPSKNVNVTCTATSVVFRNYGMMNNWLHLFPNVRDVRLHSGFLAAGSFTFQPHPLIKIMRFNVKNFDQGLLLLSSIKTYAPNLEELHVYVYERSDTDQYTPRQRLQQVYQPLEAKAEELGIKIYCRNLFLLVNDPDVFIESFNQQNLPYSYYRSSAPVNRTLLGEAVRQSSLPVVEFLLENEITTLEKEFGPYPDADLFYRCPSVRLRGHYPFLVDPQVVKEHTTAMLNYLLAKGYDINKKIDGKTFFEVEDLSHPTIMHLVSHSNVDWTVKASDNATIIHNIFQMAALEMFRYAAQKIPHDVMQELLNMQDEGGNTPLHLIYNCPEEIFDEIAKYELNWDIKNHAGATPLLSLVETLRYDNLATHFRRMVPLVPSIQKGVVSTVFAKHRSANVLLPEIELFASRGADLNEVVDETPAVMLLTCFSEELIRELVKHGVNIHVVDKNNQTLLFNLLTQNLVVNRLEILELLVKEFKFNINHLSKEHLTPLTFALKNKHNDETIAKLLELGANPNLCGFNFLPPLGHVSSNLYNAAMALPIITCLLKAGADPNMKVYNEDKTIVVLPLVKLLNSFDSLPVLHLLLEYSADIHLTDDIGNTLLHLLKFPVHIEYLLPRLDVNAVNHLGQTPLWGANLHQDSLVMMLKRNANINHVAIDGSTPLHFMHQNVHTINYLRALLREKDIDMSVVNKIGQSFAHAALSGPMFYVEIINTYNNCSDEIMRAKIRSAFNHVDIFGCTALHYICDSRVDVSVVKQFVETFELDVNPKSNFILQASWLPEVIEYLLSRGSDPNKQSADGNTLLHAVCGKAEKLDVVKILLKYGASIEIKNNFGQAPVDIDPNLRNPYGAVYYGSLNKEEPNPPNVTVRRAHMRFPFGREDNLDNNEDEDEPEEPF